MKLENPSSSKSEQKNAQESILPVHEGYSKASFS